MAQQSSQFSPAYIAKIAPSDAIHLSEYIDAIEKQNKSQNNERKLMEKYIDDLTKEVEELRIMKRGVRERENKLNEEIGKLRKEIEMIEGKVADREGVIKEKNSEIEEYKERLINIKIANDKENSFKEQKISLLKEENKKLLQSQEKFQEVLATLKEKCAKYEELYAASTQNKEIFEHTFQRFLEENKKLKEEFGKSNLNENISTSLRATSELDSSQYYQLKEEISNLCKKLLETNQEAIKAEEQLKSESEKRRKVTKEIEDLKEKYNKDQLEWDKKQVDLKHFISYVQNQMVDMDKIIREQESELQTLRETNKKLKKDVIGSVNQFINQNHSEKELARVQVELASCKGRLAEKERQMLSSRSLIWNLPSENSIPNGINFDEREGSIKNKKSEKSGDIKRKSQKGENNFKMKDFISESNLIKSQVKY